MLVGEPGRELERHWGLERDPFTPDGSIYVSTPVHAAAENALAAAIGAGASLVSLSGESGLGKTLVLERAMARARSPHRRLARIRAPLDGCSLYVELAAALGRRVKPSASRAEAWRALSDAVRVCRFQESSVVLAIDGQSESLPSDDQLEKDIDRLAHLGPDPRFRLTVVRVSCSAPRAARAAAVPIQLRPLSRIEAAEYLDSKLRRSGREQPAFAPRAATRLHALARGVPRVLDLLASISLQVAAARKLDVVPHELIDDLDRRNHDDARFAASI
jgi:hypothetical protein